MLAIFVLSAAFLGGADPGMDLESLRRIIDGLQDQLKDVEFCYEGGLVNTQNRASSRNFESSYQGRFAYRSDGCVHVDLFVDFPEPERPIERQVACLFDRSKLYQMRYRPDQRGLLSADVQKEHGGIPSLDREMSPLRYWKMPQLLELLRDSGGYRTNNRLQYDCLGWEDVGVRNCLRVRFMSKDKVLGSTIMQQDYWLDMERAGTPLRYEFRHKNVLWSRVEVDQLKELPIPGSRSTWLPVHGVFRSFLKAERTAEGIVHKESDLPLFEETFVVLDGTFAMNRSLPNERFTINWSPQPQGDLINSKRIEHSALVGRRSDAMKVAQDKVSRTVVEAERQVTLLQASAPTREWISSTVFGSVALTLLGLALVLSPWLMRRWNR